MHDLFKRHPLPWRVKENDAEIHDANGIVILDIIIPADSNESQNLRDIVEVMNSMQDPNFVPTSCHHYYVQKDQYWKSCKHCGMIAPLKS